MRLASWLVVGPLTPSLFGHRCTMGDSVAKRQPLLCVVGVVTSCVPCARVRTSRSRATENTYTPARLEALFKLSVVTVLSHPYHYTKLSAGCGCSFQLVILLNISSKFSYLLYAVSQFFFVHANADLCLSREMDHFRMLSRQSLDFTVIFATRHTLYFVSAVL